MKRDKHITKVKFLYHSADDDLFAFFPEEMYNDDKDLRTSYSHIGQHSACSVDYAKECREATKEEYKELEIELSESIGYKLEILN